MDAVICQFGDEGTQLIATHSQPFDDGLREVLLALCQPNGVRALNDATMTVLDLSNKPQSELDWWGWASKAYAHFASHVVHELLVKADISVDEVLAIGCHGQTVRHRPELGFSLQLVDPNIIAEQTGITVVTDFRRRDMAVGGQGAPLAPAFHLAQFGNKGTDVDNDTDTKTHRIVVNLGGIANITVLPSENAHQEYKDVYGYDTGPASNLLDAWYQYQVAQDNIPHEFTSNKLYDMGGRWAQSGTVNQKLLAQLLTHPYFAKPIPKSTGREDFNLGWLSEQISKVEASTNSNISAQDVQATLTYLTVITLSSAIIDETCSDVVDDLDDNNDESGKKGEIIVCGGGAYNAFLMTLLAKSLPDWTVLTSEDFGIAPTWVEAMAFAWLAQQTITGNTGNLPVVTGATKAVVLGQVCFA